MLKRRSAIGVVCAVLLGTLGFASSASATLTGAFTRFQFCPYTTAGVDRCALAVTESGEVVLGSKKVPIVNPVTLQGGYTDHAEEGPEAEFSKFVGATNGVTLSKAAQPVPGGLLGLIPPESSPPIVKALLKAAVENGLTGVNSTLELAGSASDIRISEGHLAEGIGVALKLPVKVHLENPVLGSSCYVGSNTSPIIWELTDGVTAPPGPNESITGAIGSLGFLEKGLILELTENVLVDNAWAAPAASGCGGLLSVLIDPVINSVAGLPAAAGHNTAILKNTVSETTAFAVNRNNEEHP